MPKYEVKLKGSLLDKRGYTVECDMFRKGASDFEFYKYTDTGEQELVALFDRQMVACVVKLEE